MADERDLDLLDDYLSNRMGGADRSEFEQKMQADPDLQGEYALQKVLLDGIRDARVAELKTMLRNVPVPTPGNNGNAFTSKVVLGALAIIFAATAYWFLTRDETGVRTPAPVAEQKITDEQPVTPATPSATEAREEETKASVKKPMTEPDKNQTSAGTEHSKPSLSGKPDPIPPPAAGKKEGDAGTDKEASPSGQATETDQALRPVDRPFAVETVTGNSSYRFHYQFRDGKLLLYGPFGEGQYEVSTFLMNDRPATFLYYNNQYYLLESENGDVKTLTPLTDQTLRNQLDRYRSK